MVASDRDRLIDARLKNHRANDNDYNVLLEDIAGEMVNMELLSFNYKMGTAQSSIHTDRDSFMEAWLKKNRSVLSVHDTEKSEVCLDKLVAAMARMEVEAVMRRKNLLELETVLRVYDRAAVDVAWSAAMFTVDANVDLSDLKDTNGKIMYSSVDSVIRHCYLAWAQHS